MFQMIIGLSSDIWDIEKGTDQNEAKHSCEGHVCGQKTMTSILFKESTTAGTTTLHFQMCASVILMSMIYFCWNNLSHVKSQRRKNALQKNGYSFPFLDFNMFIMKVKIPPSPKNLYFSFLWVYFWALYF